MNKFSLALFLTLTCAMSVWADIKSNDGSITFDVNSDGIAESILNTTGLGIGTTPSTNLHVAGNARVDSLTVGGSSTSSSNLLIDGSLGMAVSRLTTSANLDQSHNTLILADSSSDNLFIRLPNPIEVPGRIYKIKKTVTANEVRVYLGLDNVLGQALSAGNTGSLEVISSGNYWYIMEGNDLENVVVSDNLVVHYPFGEAQGATSVSNATGLGLNGPLDGNIDDVRFSSTVGVIGPALSFLANGRLIEFSGV